MSKGPLHKLNINNRDRAVLTLYCHGLNHIEAAEYLRLPPNSVRNRSGRIREYLGLTNNSALVHWALENHVVKPVPLWAPLDLTPLERGTIELLSEGLIFKEIAARQGVNSLKSIASRVVRAMNRNRAFSREHLIAMVYSEACYPQGDLRVLKAKGSVWEEWYGNHM